MKELPSTAKLATVWLLIGTALFLAVQAWLAQQRKAQFSARGGVIELARAADGHFHWPGRIGDVAVDFMVDTGATRTAIPQALAERAGLARGPELQSDTAGGVAHGWVSRATLSLDGGVQASALPVAVLPQLQTPLLGMDVLSKLRFTQQGGTLRIEPPHTEEP